MKAIEDDENIGYDHAQPIHKQIC